MQENLYLYLILLKLTLYFNLDYTKQKNNKSLYVIFVAYEIRIVTNRFLRYSLRCNYSSK